MEQTMTFREAITAAMREEMERDESVFVIGEDVGKRGGVRGVTKGLWKQFGADRVIDSPISEMAMAGACVGAAMRGRRPIAEIYFGDIIIFMADNIVTTAARLPFATAGKMKAPIVFRGGDASRPDGGPHQDTLASWFAHVPGIKVVVPSTPKDAKGLMVSAIRDDNPVIFLEPCRLYDMEGPVPEGNYTTPLGKADIKAEGSDVTIACIGRCVHLALEAKKRWEELGVSLEVLDLMSLRPLDSETIRASVAKTGRLVVAHEGWTPYGIGSEVISRVSDGPELLLEEPAQRVSTLDTHIPASPRLAEAILPNAQRIDAAVGRVIRSEKVPALTGDVKNF